MLKKKVKQLDKTVEFMKQNESKTNFTILKEYDGVK